MRKSAHQFCPPPAIARAVNKPDVSSSSLLLRRPCSIPIVEQALSYIERIECNAQRGMSILKSVGSSPIPRPDGSLRRAAIRQYSSTSPKGTAVDVQEPLSDRRAAT